jgi:hypothetical protein
LQGSRFGSWAWVELNYRPHAYQAGSCEHELGSEVPIRMPSTNILLRISRIQEHLGHFHEHFARANGPHNGHHRDPRASEANSLPRVRVEFLEPVLLVSAEPVEHSLYSIASPGVMVLRRLERRA